MVLFSVRDSETLYENCSSVIQETLAIRSGYVLVSPANGKIRSAPAAGGGRAWLCWRWRERGGGKRGGPEVRL